MLYLLDANVLITAASSYYPIDQVPEYWSWLRFQGEQGVVKLPFEIMEEVLLGHKDDDPLLDWLKHDGTENVLTFDEDLQIPLLQRVLEHGYASDLTDDEIEQVGRDPFLVAYALADPQCRCVVTTEVSRPSKTRQNRKVPDVCRDMRVSWSDPFAMNRALGFSTSWQLKLGGASRQ